LLRGIVGEGASGNDAVRLIDHWCLDRKLRERLQELGENEGAAYRIVSLLKLALSRTTPDKTPTKNRAAAGKATFTSGNFFVKELFQATDAREFLGVNVFEGVEWFNKERLDEALLFAPLIAAIESDGALEERAAKKTPPPKKASGEKKRAHAITATTSKTPLDVKKWHQRLELIARTVTDLENAEKVSGYRVDLFLAGMDDNPVPD
jgi:hypothetical protein